MQIQADMTERALELLNIRSPEPQFILDIGCGSGLSGDVLTETGHFWVGLDISPSMLSKPMNQRLYRCST
jgi:18S rRNA (guanine1575-N7)-methyltransferase